MNWIPFWNRRRKTRAQTIVEFALVLPVLVLVILGIIAFGQLFSYKIRLDNAAREGVRKGITGGTKAEIQAVVIDRCVSMPGANNSTCGAARSGISCLYVTVMPDDDSAAAVASGAGACTAAASPMNKRKTGTDMVVKARYDAYVSTPLIGFFMSPKTLYSRAVMRIESCPP